MLVPFLLRIHSSHTSYFFVKNNFSFNCCERKTTFSIINRNSVSLRNCLTSNLSPSAWVMQRLCFKLFFSQTIFGYSSLMDLFLHGVMEIGLLRWKWIAAVYSSQHFKVPQKKETLIDNNFWARHILTWRFYDPLISSLSRHFNTTYTDRLQGCFYLTSAYKTI